MDIKNNIEEFIQKKNVRKLYNKVSNFDKNNIKEIILEQIEDICADSYDDGYEEGFMKGMEIVAQYIDSLYDTKDSSKSDIILKELKDLLKELNNNE